MSGIKDVFVSRFKDGKLIEVDYDQLEVAALAILSKDPQLIKDLNDKVDIHRRNAAVLFGLLQRQVTPEQRKLAKSLSFQLQYGAGAKGMSEKLGVPQTMCETFIDLYYKTYPKVKEWQDKNIAWCKENREPHESSLGLAKLPSLTGRVYVFQEEKTQFPSRWKPEQSFKPTVIKNYPVQGFATGDIVPHMLGELYKEISLHNYKSEYKILLINTIHDSYLLDVHPYAVDKAIRILQRVLGNTSNTVAEYFGLDKFPVTLGISISIGDTWGDMKEYEESKA